MSDVGKSHCHELVVLEQEPEDWGPALIFALFRVHSRMERRVAEVLAAHDMTLAQFDVLATLSHGEGITQQELAGRLLVTKGNVVGLIDRLCMAGLVERRADPCDRRAKTLYLTEQGRKRFIEAIPCVTQHRKKLLSVFTQDELRQMHNLLRRLDESAQE